LFNCNHLDNQKELSLPFEETEISGVRLFSPEIFEDSRGFFYESFKFREVAEIGDHFSVMQVNNSVSNSGALRGIHFKRDLPGQAKFISVQSGTVFDVAIDLRKSSSTFGKWQGFVLSSENNFSLLIGRGIGHAFLALEKDTRVSYLCDTEYEPRKEFSINPLSAGIDWQKIASEHNILEFGISNKDQEAPALSEAAHLLFE
jgi:dTDP-4-dehydrorhamnose 3,5-epimerase